MPSGNRWITPLLIALAVLWIAPLNAQPATPASTAPTSQQEDPINDAAFHDASVATYRDAVKILTGLLTAEKDPAEKSHLRYLIARTHQVQGRCDLAITEYLTLEREAVPDDAWLPRARFARSECLAEQGRKEEAVTLFSDQAETLLAPDRRLKLAEQLSELAREALKPTKPGKYPDPGRADSLYRLVLGLELTGALQQEAEHHAAVLEGDSETLALRIRKDPTGTWACRDRIALAEQTRDAMSFYYIAHSCPAEQAVKATFALSDQEQSQRAIKALRDSIASFPTDKRHHDLQKRLALLLTDSAPEAEAWKAVEDVFAHSGTIDPQWILNAARGFAYRDEGDRARQLWLLLKEHTTQPALIEQSRYQWIALRHTEYQRLYTQGAMEEALEVLKKLGDEIPSELQQTRTLRGQVLAQLGRWEDAQTLWVEAATSVSKQHLVELLEERGMLKEAQPHRGDQSGERHERLEVVVPRVFTSAETPKLFVRSDALAKLELRLHPIDVEAHMRSMATLGDLDSLDVDLIAPDETREVSLSAPTTPGYQQPGPTRAAVDIGALAPGVYALQSIGDKQEATSILRISDLTMVTRAVGGDLVVLVLDQKTKGPAAGVEVLVSDGGKIVAEGKTDAKGFFRQSLKVQQVEVLAKRGAHSTWANVYAEGAGQTAAERRVEIAKTRQVWAMLDREQVKAGEEVHYLALISEGESPRVLPSGEAEVKFSGPAGELWTRKVKLVNGVVEGSLEIPWDSPSGYFSLQIADKTLSLRVGEPGSNSGTIRIVQEKPAELGGSASVMVEVLDPGGNPIAGQELSGDLRDGKEHRVLGRSDAAGRLSLPVTVDAGLPMTEVYINGISHTIERAHPHGEATLTVTRLEQAKASTFSVEWKGGETAQSFITLRRVRAINRQDKPTLKPNWWLDINDTARRKVVHHDVQRLSADTLTASIPALEPGAYLLDVEMLRDDGITQRVSRPLFVPDAAELLLTSDACEGGWDEPCEVEHQGALELMPHSQSSLPLLLTVERQGILESQLISAGKVERLQLPEGLVGEGRVTLTQFGEDAGSTHQSSLSVLIERRLKLGATFDPAVSDEVVVTLADREGKPVSGSVFVAITPIDQPIEESEGVLFPPLSYKQEGHSGWSQDWSSATVGANIDQEIRDLDDELNFARQEARPSPDAPMNMPKSMNKKKGKVQSYKPQSAPLPQSIAARHRPALWKRLEVDASGRVTERLSTASLPRGEYRLTAVLLEGADAKTATASTGHSGTMLSKSFLLDTPTTLAPVETDLVMGDVQDHRVVLSPGQSLTLNTDGATRVMTESARSDRSEWVARLLSPDLASEREGSWWQEQLITYQMMQEKKAEWAGESLLLRTWIAAYNTSQSRYNLPRLYGSQSTLVSALESLPEGEVRERAEVLLGIGRQQPSHGQAKAALLRLQRNPEAIKPEVVGTLALAALALESRAEELRDLIDPLKAAATSGPLLDRARALEALARLNVLPLPADPAELMKELAPRAQENKKHVIAMTMGSLVRALLLSDQGIGGDAGFTITEADGAPAMFTPGRHDLRINPATSSVTIAPVDEPIALRVRLVNKDATPATKHTLTRVAQRHGLWFRGVEIMPPVSATVEENPAPVVGRRLRIRLDVNRASGSSSRQLILEEPLPPGTQLITDSVTGYRLKEVRDGRMLLIGSDSRHTIITYDVEVLDATDARPSAATWLPTILRAPDGEVIATAAAADFKSTAQTKEQADRLRGEPIWPVPAANLTEREKIAIGAAIGTAKDVNLPLYKTSLELLWPLLFKSQLNTNEVRQVGEAAFRASLALEDDQAIREVFSILEARAPSASVTQKELLQVARAFDRQGDLEYAHRAWNALLNLRFLAEVGAGEGLIDSGLPAEGLHLVHDLTRSYPDLPSVQQSLFNLPQLFINQAQMQPANPEGRVEAKRYRRTAAQWLAEYLIRYRDDRADQAALMQINVVHELEEWERMVQLAERHSERLKESKLVDSFIFLSAYGHQRLGNYKESQTRFQRIVDEEFNGQPSPDRHRAKLAIAQIYQAQGKLTKALELYREVQGRFTDAAAAVQILENAELRVPNVVTTEPGKGLELPLRVRGVDQLRGWVYAVDLERLFLREKQIRAVEDISLAGIKPVLDFDVKLGAVYGNLADHPLRLDLKKPGAYLVLLRGPTVRASTLAIVSDLKMDIVEDMGSNSLHVSVSKLNDSTPQEGALVRFAHPGAAQTESSKSDLRGMVKLNGYNRSTHVLAKVGDAYAVYRGTEPDLYAMPSQIQTGHARRPSKRRRNRQQNFDSFDMEAPMASPASEGLLQGQKQRALEMQNDNIMMYEQKVLRNRRSESNFLLD